MLAAKTTRRVILLNLLAIFATIAIAAPLGRLYRQFEDGGFITYFSVIQLFVLSYITGKTFNIRKQAFPLAPWKSPVAIWGIFSLGFSFLALDDLLMIHEFFDKTIHQLWQIQETGLTDRIDDAIIALYAVVAIALLVIYRQELKRYRPALPAAVAAFGLLFAMVAVDAITNRNEILEMLFSASTAEGIQAWVFTVEDGLKLLAEGFYVAAAHRCLQLARRLHTAAHTATTHTTATHTATAQTNHSIAKSRADSSSPAQKKVALTAQASSRAPLSDSDTV